MNKIKRISKIFLKVIYIIAVTFSFLLFLFAAVNMESGCGRIITGVIIGLVGIFFFVGYEKIGTRDYEGQISFIKKRITKENFIKDVKRFGVFCLIVGAMFIIVQFVFWYLSK